MEPNLKPKIAFVAREPCEDDFFSLVVVVFCFFSHLTTSHD